MVTNCTFGLVLEVRGLNLAELSGLSQREVCEHR